MTKQQKLKPHLLRCIERLQKLIDLDGPAIIIGHEAFNVYATALAVYGEAAGKPLLQHLRDQNLHERGVCSHEDCTRYVERPDSGICETCQKALGIDDSSIEEIERTYEKDPGV